MYSLHCPNSDWTPPRTQPDTLLIDDTSVMNFGKNLQYDFPKMRGGGQRRFGIFPKIHLFWRRSASLREEEVWLPIKSN